MSNKIAVGLLIKLSKNNEDAVEAIDKFYHEEVFTAEKEVKEKWNL